MSEILDKCRAFCANDKCMSGDTCSPMMHDEPCYGEIADHIEALEAQLAEARAEVERLEDEIENPIYCIKCGSCGEEGCCPAEICKYPGYAAEAFKDRAQAAEAALAEAQAQLQAIEEDGTREHNAAINLRKKLAKARMAANSTPLLQKIRSALGMNEKFPFSHLDAKAAEIVRRAQAAEAALAAEQAKVAVMAEVVRAATQIVTDDCDWVIHTGCWERLRAAVAAHKAACEASPIRDSGGDDA